MSMFSSPLINQRWQESDALPQIYSDQPLETLGEDTDILDVFFSRQGEVIHGLSAIPSHRGEGVILFVELGKYLSLQESRDFIHLTEPCLDVLYSLLVSVVQDEDQSLKWRLKVVSAIYQRLWDKSLKNEYNKGGIFELEDRVEKLLDPYFMRFYEEGGLVLESSFSPFVEGRDENIVIVPGYLIGSDVVQLSFLSLNIRFLCLALDKEGKTWSVYTYEGQMESRAVGGEI